MPANYTFTSAIGQDNGSHSFSAKLQTVGIQTITATDTVAPSITGTSNPIAVTPNALLGQVVTTDADFKNVDGFDVLFTKGSNNSVLKLKNTNPGTLHYLLTLTNETGATIHDNTVLNSANGATASVILTVPGLPANVGTPSRRARVAATRGLASAFTAQGGKAVHAHPDDKTDEMPVQVSYATTAPGGDCSAATYTNGQPPDGALVKCIKITGFSIPKHHKAKIDVSFEFAVKNTDGWNTNAQTMFRAGFVVQVQHERPSRRPDRLEHLRQLLRDPGSRPRRGGPAGHGRRRLRLRHAGQWRRRQDVKLYNVPGHRLLRPRSGQRPDPARWLLLHLEVGLGPVAADPSNLPSGCHVLRGGLPDSDRTVPGGPLHQPQALEQGVRRGGLLHHPLTTPAIAHPSPDAQAQNGPGSTIRGRFLCPGTMSDPA